MSSTRRALLDQVKVNDPQSWSDFVETYRPLILQTVIQRGVPQNDVQDVVQDVFTRLVRELPRFSYDRDRGRFRSWLRRVTTNAVFDWHRKRQKVNGLGHEVQSLAEICECVHQDSQRELMQLAMRRVKAETRSRTWACFEQHLVLGRPADEIARELGLTTNAVYINSSRVLDRVRQSCHGTKEKQ